MSDARSITAEAELRRFRSYSSYSPVRAGFLTEIPSHWRMNRLKTVAFVQLSNVDKKSVEGEAPILLCNYTDVYYNDRITASIDFMPATATPDQITRFALRRGYVLITKDSESWSDIAVPAVVAEDLEDVICGYHLAHVRPGPSLDGRFLARAFAAKGLRDQFYVAANGITRFGLSADDITSAWFPIPPLEEQRVIADCLDREMSKIDAVAAEKKRLIELLLEKRSALIARAVAKGLDPTVPMRNSNADWLGEVPAHWDVERIKWVARMESGHTPDKKIESYWLDGDIPWVSLADTGQLRQVDYITDTAVKTTSDGLAHSSARILPAGTVVFSRDATVGLCAITGSDMAVSQHFIGWVCGPRMTPEYLLLVLRSMTQELERLTMGATIRTIGMPDVKSLTTPVPPIHEQQEIVRHVRTKTAQIDALIARVEDAIERLSEFRVGLISAAVTGKIDIRELVVE